MTPRSSVIFDTVLDTVTRTAAVLSIFLLFAGHNAPGGGFIGGLVLAAAFVLRYVAGGTPRIDSVARVEPATLLGAGLTLAVLFGAGGWLWGSQFLTSAKFDLHVPAIGTLHLTSALGFDIGVYLIVVGLGLVVLRSLGAEADQEPAQ